MSGLLENNDAAVAGGVSIAYEEDRC